MCGVAFGAAHVELFGDGVEFGGVFLCVGQNAPHASERLQSCLGAAGPRWIFPAVVSTSPQLGLKLPVNVLSAQTGLPEGFRWICAHKTPQMGCVCIHAHPAGLHGSSGGQHALQSSAAAAEATTCLVMHCGEKLHAGHVWPSYSHPDDHVRNSCAVGARGENLNALAPDPVPDCSTSW